MYKTAVLLGGKVWKVHPLTQSRKENLKKTSLNVQSVEYFLRKNNQNPHNLLPKLPG